MSETHDTQGRESAARFARAFAALLAAHPSPDGDPYTLAEVAHAGHFSLAYVRLLHKGRLPWVDLDEARRLAAVFDVEPAAVLGRPLTPEENAALVVERPTIFARLSGGHGARVYADGSVDSTSPLGAGELRLIAELQARAQARADEIYREQQQAEAALSEDELLHAEDDLLQQRERGRALGDAIQARREGWRRAAHRERVECAERAGARGPLARLLHVFLHSCTRIGPTSTP